MSWQDFLNIPEGETVYNHGASQCVALANQYNEGVLGGGFVNVERAIDWWINDNVAAVHGFSKITDSPQAGDIFIGSYGNYDPYNGHIGVVVRSWDGATFGTMEQNVGGQYVSRHNRTMDNIDGFLRPVNQAPLQTAPPALAATQRQAGPEGVFRREAPSTQSARLEGDLEANEVGNFVNWTHGENVNGNDVWFQGVSGNWFWSGAFTSQSVDGLVDVTPAPPAPEVPIIAPVEPTPVPVETIPAPVEPAKPKPKPENIEHKETEVTTPSAKATSPEQLKAALDRQAALASGVKPADLGSIITNNKARKIVWAIYGIAGLFIIGIMGGFTAAQWIAPEWFIFSTGVYTAISPAFASLAMANIDTKK
jgi:hypothetical protein